MLRVIVFSLAALVAGSLPALAADRFVSVIEDLPLMQEPGGE